VWFNDPNLPFAAVTPFNGEQHAGIQALNTAEFPVNAPRCPKSAVNKPVPVVREHITRGLPGS
jgi:hypothetical protein